MAEGWRCQRACFSQLWPCHQAGDRMGTELLALLRLLLPLLKAWLSLDLFKLDPHGLGWMGCELVSQSLTVQFLTQAKQKVQALGSSLSIQCESLGDAL